MKVKVGHFHEGQFREIVSGSEEYCRGFLDRYNLYSDIDAVILVGDRCQCGPERVEVVHRGDRDKYDRTGCSRCNRWDGPVRLRSKT